MLSRIAESLFWIGRYVERADDTARVLDVGTQLLIEDATLDEQETCQQLLAIMGVESEGPVDRFVLLHQLLYDPASPSSVASALGAARESARRARETLSTDMWQAINTTYHTLNSGQVRSMRAPTAFGWVRDRAALVSGIADGTMSRDDGWLFLTLGRNIERADMTARLLATASLGSGPVAAWTSTLRACGAYEAFLRTYRGIETDLEAAEFLLLDRIYPRSVVAALTRAEVALERLDASAQRSGFDDAQRLLGRARAELEYRPLREILDGLGDEMERVQEACSSATMALSRKYFHGAAATSWTGGAA